MWHKNKWSSKAEIEKSSKIIQSRHLSLISTHGYCRFHVHWCDFSDAKSSFLLRIFQPDLVDPALLLRQQVPLKLRNAIADFATLIMKREKNELKHICKYMHMQGVLPLDRWSYRNFDKCSQKTYQHYVHQSYSDCVISFHSLVLYNNSLDSISTRFRISIL